VTMTNQWWHDFFSGLWVTVQQASKTDEQTEEEASFIKRCLDAPASGSLLDVPCGVGRHSIAMAKRGFHVTGVDISKGLLDRAEKAAEGQDCKPFWVNQDMQTVDWQDKFDGAYCYWGSFGYFDDEGNTDFLRAVYRSLKPGARFLIDTHTVETLLPKLGHTRSWKRVGETYVLDENSYNPYTSRTETTWTLIHEGECFEQSTSIRLYTLRELQKLVEEVGFSVVAQYGDLQCSPFGLKSPRLYIVLSK